MSDTTKKLLCPECGSKLLIGLDDKNDVSILDSKRHPELDKKVSDKKPVDDKTSTGNSDKKSKLVSWFTDGDKWDDENYNSKKSNLDNEDDD